MSALVKARSVLDLDFAGTHYVTFSSRDEDTGHVLRSATFSAQDYEDMGRPEQVTITIEPGDQLTDAVEPPATSNTTIAEHVELVAPGEDRQTGLWINGKPAGFAVDKELFVEAVPLRPHLVQIAIWARRVTLPERVR